MPYFIVSFGDKPESIAVRDITNQVKTRIAAVPDQGSRVEIY
jgi:hypothetical protein